MFRIRKITNPYLKGNKQAIEQIKKIKNISKHIQNN